MYDSEGRALWYARMPLSYLQVFLNMLWLLNVASMHEARSLWMLRESRNNYRPKNQIIVNKYCYFLIIQIFSYVLLFTDTNYKSIDTHSAQLLIIVGILIYNKMSYIVPIIIHDISFQFHIWLPYINILVLWKYFPVNMLKDMKNMHYLLISL